MKEEDIPSSPFQGKLVAKQSFQLTQSLFCCFYRSINDSEWSGSYPTKTKKGALESVGWANDAGFEILIYEIQLPNGKLNDGG